MKSQVLKWISNDGKSLFARCWEPEKSSAGVILFVHGLGEHSGRYERWANLFTNAGYSFLTFDQRGHGNSASQRGHTRSLDALMDDINLLYNKSDELFPGQPKVLYGQSMGGTLVLNFVIRYNHTPDALIVTSPWLKLYKEPDSLTMIISGFLKWFFPFLKTSNRIKPEQLSHDPEIISEYTRDPLVHNRISLRMFYILYEAGLYALRNIYKINCPLLLMHGSSDTITSPSVSEAYTLYTNDKTSFKLWDNQFHELHNELIYKEVFDFISSWLRDTVAVK